MRRLRKPHGDDTMHNHNLESGLDTALYQMLQLKHHCHYGYVRLDHHHSQYGEYMLYVNDEDLPIREGQPVSFRIKSIPITVSAYVQVDLFVAYDLNLDRSKATGMFNGEIIQE